MGAGGLEPPPTLKNHKHIGFLGNTGLDPLEHHKATRSVYGIERLAVEPMKAGFLWYLDPLNH